MELKPSISVATVNHAKSLAWDIRKEDRAEILASRGCGPRKAIVDSLKLSHVAYTFFVGGRVAAMFGVVKASSAQDGEFGIPWVLTGNAVDEHPLAFWRMSRKGLGIFLEEYKVLINLVDARHESSIRWLTHLGAKILPAEPHGPKNFLFHKFIFRRP